MVKSSQNKRRKPNGAKIRVLDKVFNKLNYDEIRAVLLRGLALPEDLKQFGGTVVC